MANRIAVTLLSALPAVATPEGSNLETALRFFTRHGASRVAERLDATRPAPVSPGEKESVLATLPPKGEVRELDSGRRRKLAAARGALRLHARETVYEVKVIDVPQAAVALHGRAVVLVSAPALDVLGADELQALVAHEVGHEYFWSEYSRARRDDDRSRLRTIELLCDGIAIVTLWRAGMEPDRLSSALEKIVRYNARRFGVAGNEEDYPPSGERRRFAARLAAWLGPAHGPPSPGELFRESPGSHSRRAK